MALNPLEASCWYMCPDHAVAARLAYTAVAPFSYNSRSWILFVEACHIAEMRVNLTRWRKNRTSPSSLHSQNIDTCTGKCHPKVALQSVETPCDGLEPSGSALLVYLFGPRRCRAALHFTAVAPYLPTYHTHGNALLVCPVPLLHLSY